MTPSDRDSQMVQHYAAGETLEEIGARFGLTRERVRQIIKRVGGVDAEAARLQRAGAKVAVQDAERASFMEKFGLLAEELAGLGYPRESAVDRIVALYPDVDRDLAINALRVSRIVFSQAPAENHFSIAELQAGLWFLVGSNQRLDPDLHAAARDLPDDLLRAVPEALSEADVTPQDVATILGVIAAARRIAEEDIELTITGKRYQELRLELIDALGLVSAQGQTPWPPTRQTLTKRFGGWNESLESIGLAISGIGRPKGLVVYTEAEYLGALRDYYRFAEEIGVNPTFAGYGEWVAREKVAGRRRPASASVRLQYGSWLDALRIAQRTAVGSGSPNEGRSASEHPVVGAEWHPLIYAMVALTNALRPATFWRMDTYSGAQGYDPYTSPYAQVMLDQEGFLRVEVQGHTPIGGRRDELELIGWETPDSAPNAYRRYANGWNTVTVATEIIGALALLFEFRTEDLVAFGSKSDAVRELGVMAESQDGIFRIEDPDRRVFEPGLPLEQSDGFDTAVEILARLLEADLIDSPGVPVSPDVARGPLRRQGVSYQQSMFSDNEIVAWMIDVTSWPDPESVDWIDHLEQLDSSLPLALVTGANWALSVRKGQQDSDVPERLASDISTLIPGSYVQWSRGQDAEWFEPQFTSASAVVEALAKSGFEVETVAPIHQLGEYLTESLDDDTFVFFRVRAPGGPAAVACAFIEDDVAQGAARALDGYLESTFESSTVAGDGWVVRVVAAESLEVDEDEYAQQIAEALGATFASSSFVDVDPPRAVLDAASWGPQAVQMKAMLVWASRYIFAVPQEQWDDARVAAWNRILVAAVESSRTSGIEQATDLMSAISTNDFFDHTGVEALHALAMRDLISPEDYNTFTLPWRAQVGRIHPDDAEVRRRPGAEAHDKHAIGHDDMEA